MIGLLNNSKMHDVLNQWYILFNNQSNNRSAQAYMHWQNVERLGLPNKKNEQWKATPLEGLLSHHFAAASVDQVSAWQRDNLSLTLDNACRLVFIDGYFVSMLSDIDTDLWQINIEQGANRQPLPDPIQSDIFLHLTESLSLETTRIYLPANNIADKLLYLLHISQGSTNEATLTTLHYRHHIELAPGAQGQVIEHFVSLSNQGHFSGARTSMIVGDHAQLNHIKLAFENRASYHFAHNDIHMGSNTVAHSSTFLLGAELTCHQTSAQLNGEWANISINSLLLPSKQDISDTRTYLEHNKSYCFSRQLHKIVARDHGKGIFNGLIKVAKNAFKNDGKMINNNLLLDRSAEVNTKPQLEIYADDVKCSHGATVGYINEEQMFYLRSRGITSQEAQQMIIYAFTADVIENMGNDKLYDIVLARITDALQGFAV